MKRNKGGVSFVKEATGGFLNKKEREQGVKDKFAPFLLPRDRSRGGGDRGTGGPIPGGLGSAAARR